MAAIKVSTTYPLIPGTDFPITIGSLGRGKGAAKVRLIPTTKDPDQWLALLKALPKWETILSKTVATLYSKHSTGCISGVPAELTEESLKAAIDSDTIGFDQGMLNELIECDFSDERAGHVSAATKLQEWNEANGDEYTALIRELIEAQGKGVQLAADKFQRLSVLSVEQVEFSEAVATETEAKKARAAARAAKPKTA